MACCSFSRARACLPLHWMLLPAVVLAAPSVLLARGSQPRCWLAAASRPFHRLVQLHKKFIAVGSKVWDCSDIVFTLSDDLINWSEPYHLPASVPQQRPGNNAPHTSEGYYCTQRSIPR